MAGLRIAWLCALLAASCAHRGGSPPARESLLAAGGGVEVRYAPGEEEEAARVLGALPDAVAAAERWGRLPVPLRITLHPTRESLERATGLAGTGWILAWSRAAAVDLRSPGGWPGRPASARELSAILAHELTHCVLYREASGGGDWADRAIPLWFREGMASVAAGELHPRAGPEEVAALLAGARSERLQAAAHGAFLFLCRRHGEERVRRLVARMGEGLAFAEAFQDATGASLAAFERELLRAAAGPRG